ncbi:MAG: hypothetical protein IT376_16940, partial [Polyangiaceae bacterium]|nr:hypothetical protein [Polyangiaceae bacterium]
GGGGEVRGARRAEVVDDCAVVPGRAAPEPLKRVYTGVAARARCDREVYTIMGGLTHFLGVSCEHCHVPDDYAAPTHRKDVANWMARELVPRVARPGGGAAWCNDCHVVDGHGTARILREPRDRAWAMEWMTVHLSDRLSGADGRPLRCRDCHGGEPGSGTFRRALIPRDPGAPD